MGGAMRTFGTFVAVSVLALFLIHGDAFAQTKEEGIKLYNEANGIRENARSKEDLIKATEKYEAALKIFEQAKFDYGIAAATCNLGIVYQDLGEYPKAVGYYERSLAKSRRIDNVSIEGKCLHNLGGVYLASGRYDKAVEYYEKSLAIKRKLGDVKGEGATLNDLANVYLNWGQYAKAVEFYDRSLAIQRKLGDVKGEGRTLNNLGLVHMELGRYSKAADYYEKSLEL
jgi:tetratricopeptide (TPR) repeat protein